MSKKLSKKSSKKRKKITVHKRKRLVVKPKEMLQTMFTIKKALSIMRNPRAIVPIAVTTFTLKMQKHSGTQVGPFKLLRHMFATYGEEWLDYEPLAFLNDPFVQNNYDMLYALKVLMTTNNYFQVPHVFEKVTLALNRESVLPYMLQDLTPHWIAYSMFVANVLRDEPITDNVENYIVGHLIDDGYAVYLFPLDIENDYIPAEAIDITNKVRKLLYSEKDEVEVPEDLHYHIDYYKDVLEYLNKKIREDNQEVLNEN